MQRQARQGASRRAQRHSQAWSARPDQPPEQERPHQQGRRGDAQAILIDQAPQFSERFNKRRA